MKRKMKSWISLLLCLMMVLQLGYVCGRTIRQKLDVLEIYYHWQHP